MHILITGAAGFLGQRLARHLLTCEPFASSLKRLTLADIVLPPTPQLNGASEQPGTARVVSFRADLRDAQAVADLVTPDITAVYHLAAVVSGQAEADFDLGMAVNCDGTRNLLEAVRHQASKKEQEKDAQTKFIFASSLAVFGGQLPEVITEKTAVTPLSSYGTQKAIAELWVNDYTRKGFIDGRVLRLPTVCVRPGKPNAATSSFASSIIREPLKGEAAVCPVDPALPLWLSSPGAVVRNLGHALTLPASQFGDTRTLNLPGITVTVESMLEALAAVAGPAALAHITYERDETISRIVASWPSQFDVGLAAQLGFEGDRSFKDIVQAFISEP